MALNRVNFLDKTIGFNPQVGGVKPHKPGFGATQPLRENALGISLPGKNPFGQIAPAVQNDTVANKLNMFA